MIFVERDGMCYIPVDANMFISDSKEYGYDMKYSKEYSITDTFFETMSQFIHINDKKWINIVLDMNNICSVSSRKMGSLKKYARKIIICNVNNNRMQNIIAEDLPEMHEIEHVFFSEEINKDKIKEIIDNCNLTREEKQREIVSNIVESDKNGYFLESSGLYSNYYINTKKLFLNAEEFQYIIFSLASILFQNINLHSIDALVSSSKNGAIIAYILGGLLDIKEVHLIGIGPKYAMEIGDAIECIRAGKKYAYVFDFMCTGTEAKIVSALINSKKAYIPYAIGIAKYRNEIAVFPIKEVNSLVNTEMIDINYSISGENK